MSCLIDRVQDACRFSLYHKWAIENSPLQVYLSALIFSPGRCITRSEFENAVPQWITQKPTIADNWSACLQTLEGHSGPVTSVAWSHNATRLVSASNDYTVKIWDPATGQCVSTFEDHSGWVTSVAWSHDATRLASASNDWTVKIWDPATGQCVSTLEICRNIGYIQFHKSNSDLLHTKSGTLDLGHVANLLLGRISADPLLPKVAGYGLSNNNTWITYQGENLIWLPPEYRPLCFAVSGTTVSIGCSSGHVLIFKFSDENPIL